MNLNNQELVFFCLFKKTSVSLQKKSNVIRKHFWKKSLCFETEKMSKFEKKEGESLKNLTLCASKENIDTLQSRLRRAIDLLVKNALILTYDRPFLIKISIFYRQMAGIQSISSLLVFV